MCRSKWLGLIFLTVLFSLKVCAGESVSFFDLPEQPLNQGLIELALQANTTIIAPSKLLVNYRTTPIVGEFTHAGALALLIAKAPLQFRYFNDTHTFLIEPKATAPSPQSAPARQDHAGLASAPSIDETLVVGSRYPYRYPTLVNTQLRNGLSLFDSSRFHSVLPRELINDQNPSDLSELLRFTSGITPGDGLADSNDDFYLRGFERQAMFADGFRVSDKTAVKFSPETIESIDILKGPSTLFYGQSEPGGVVNVVRKTPQLAPKTQMKLEGGNGKQKAVVDTNHYWVASNFAARIIYADDQRTHQGDVRDVKRQTFAPSLQWSVAKTQVNVVAEYQTFAQLLDKNYSIFNSDTQLVQSGVLAEALPIARENFNATASVLQATYAYQFNNRWRMAMGYMQQTEARDGIRPALNAEGYDDLLFKAASAPEDANILYVNYGGQLAIPIYQFADGVVAGAARRLVDAQNHEVDKAINTSLEGLITWGSIVNRMSVGANFYRQTLESLHVAEERLSDGVVIAQNELSKRLLIDLIPRQVPNVNPFSYSHYRYIYNDAGIYAQLTTEWTANLSTTFGVRYSLFDGARYDLLQPSERKISPDYDVSGQLGVVYRPLDSLAIFANYSEGVKANYDFALGVNAQVPSQQAAQYEFGAKWYALDDRLIAALAVFDIHKNNVADNTYIASTVSVQEYAQETGDVLHSSVPLVGGYVANIYAQTTRGLEFDMTYNWGEHTQYVVSAAYMEPRITSGIYRGNAPVLVANRTFSQFVRHALGQHWAITAGINHVGRRAVDYDNALYLPAFSTVDVAASYAWAWGGADWRLRFGVNNLSDSQYNTTVTPGVRINTAERRAWQLTFSTQW